MAQTTTSRRRALTALIRPDARRWAALGALIAAASAGALAGPLIVRRIVDVATRGTTVGQVVRLGVLYLVVAVVTQVLNVVVVRSATRAAWRITNGLRLDITRHVLGLDHEFHRKHTPGELIQRVDGDVTNVSNFLSQVVPKVAGAVFLLSGMLAVLTVLDWRLAAGMAVYLVASALLVLSMRHRAVRESSDEMGSLAKLYGGIEERLTAVEDLRANGAENHAMWRFVEDSTETINSAVRREAAFLRMWWALQIDVAVGLVGTLALSALLVSNGAITLGTAFLLFQYVHLMIRPLEELADQLEVIQKANGAMHRVFELLDVRAHDRRQRHHRAAAGSAERLVQGSGLHVRRAAGRRAQRRRLAAPDLAQQILHDVDVEVAGGRSVGVVGRTGSGKTTFSRLLLRLVEADPRHGRSRRCRPSPTSPWPSCAGASPSSPRRSSCSRARSATTSRCSTRCRPTPTSSRRCATSASTGSSTPGSIDRSAPAGPGCRPVRRSSSLWRGCGCATPTSSSSTRRRRGSTPRPSSASPRRSPS